MDVEWSMSVMVTLFVYNEFCKTKKIKTHLARKSKAHNP